MYKVITILFLAVFSTGVLAQNKVLNSFGKGFVNIISQDSSFSMKLGLRVQTLYTGSWNINDTSGIDAGTSNFSIRRARIKLDGFVFTPKLEYKIEIGLSNRDIGKVDERSGYAPKMILDAIVKWNFYKNFTLWAGQTKLPGNRERVLSSANMQMVDRSLLNSEFNIDRDIGFQLRHDFTIGKQFLVREIIAFSQGEGRSNIQNNLGGYQYTGRLEFLPMGEFAGGGDYVGGDLKREAKPKLAIGVSYDLNNNAVKDRSNQGNYMTYDLDKNGDIDGYFKTNISTIFADLMFNYKGFSLMSEYAYRDAKQRDFSIMNDDSTFSTASVRTGSAFNVQAGYVFKKNWEIAARYTQVAPTVKGKPQYEQYTLGVSKYIVGHKLKVQADFGYMITNNSPDRNLLCRLQLDLHF